jgi:8-oxo-dGTP pyrophosphatase MutT (NUDIX family)
VDETSEVIARGPWDPAQVKATWREDHFQVDPELSRAADERIAQLRASGSPSFDGLAARLVRFEQRDGSLELELQPERWALRLQGIDVAGSLSALCVVRDEESRWLVGRRAQWVASWPGRWALGAAGAVDVGENPVQTLTRELAEEWSATGKRLSVEALLRARTGMVMLVGQCWLPAGTQIVANDEHDRFEWWPPRVADWPREIDPSMRQIGQMLEL